MDVFKKKWRKAVEKCKSMNVDHQRLCKRSRSWPERRGSTPQGCFAVYVGPGRERFVVGAQQSAHPLFRALLEAAETEYGHSCRGPLLLPCHVDLFCTVLAQIDCDRHMSTDEIRPPGGFGMAMRSPRGKGYSPLNHI